MSEASSELKSKPKERSNTKVAILWVGMFVVTATGTAYAGLYSSGMLMRPEIVLDTASVPLIVDMDHDGNEELLTTVIRETIFDRKLEQVVAFRSDTGVAFWSPRIELEPDSEIAYVGETFFTMQSTGEVSAFRYKDRRVLWEVRLARIPDRVCAAGSDAVRFEIDGTAHEYRLDDGTEAAGGELDCGEVPNSRTEDSFGWKGKGLKRTKDGISVSVNATGALVVNSGPKGDWTVEMPEGEGTAREVYPVGNRAYVTYTDGRIWAVDYDSKEPVELKLEKVKRPKLVAKVEPKKP